MKTTIAFICGLILCLSPLAHAENLLSETVHHCNIDGCQVKCAGKKGDWLNAGSAEKVTVSIYQGGITNIKMDQGLNRIQTLIMGGEGYICSISNQKD